MCFKKNKKDTNVEVFNTITNKNEVKTMAKHFMQWKMQIQ